MRTRVFFHTCINPYALRVIRRVFRRIHKHMRISTEFSGRLSRNKTQRLPLLRDPEDKIDDGVGGIGGEEKAREKERERKKEKAREGGREAEKPKTPR